MITELTSFLSAIEYEFKDNSLLQEALTHPSFFKKDYSVNYQRLEFLGDKILSAIIAELLIIKYPDENEGKLSKRQAYLVSGEAIAEVAEQIGIGKVIIMSEGEKIRGGQKNKRNIENAFEALIGAIYLDGGLESCKKLISRLWKQIIAKNQDPMRDPVSYLQELVQSKSKKLPKYTIQRSGGNEHQPIFTATVEVEKQKYHAHGSSKKQAQKNVACCALSAILPNLKECSD